MSHSQLEALMAAHNEATGEHFEVVWDPVDAAATNAEAEAHSFALPTLDGTDFRFTPGEQPAVIAFWASWCAPCVAEAPHLARLHGELGERVQFAGVSVDEPAHHGKLKAMVKRMALPYPIPLDADGSVYATFNPGGSIPYTVVIDAAGAVTYVSTNFEEGDEVKLEAAIRAVAK